MCAARFSIESLESRSLLTGSTFTINLANQTGLNPSQFAIYALGYGTRQSIGFAGQRHVCKFLGAAGQIPSYKVGSGAGDLSTITLSQNQAVTGAIVYFFVVPLPVTTTPFLTYANGGSTVIQPQNPPSNQLPSGQGSFVYQFIEFTQPLNGLPTVDVSEVDGFIMPINVTVDNGMQVGQPLYQSGQTPVVNRADIFTAYTNFVANISSPTLRQAYQDLIINSTTVAGQPIGILNPGIQLASGAHPNSPLNTLWDTDLTTLFTTSVD